MDLTDRPVSDRAPIKVEFHLHNPSTSPIVVTAIKPSCTCTTFTAKGRPDPPFTLDPGEETTIGLATNPATHYGPQSYGLAISSKAGGRDLEPLVARLKVFVDSPLMPFPLNLNAGRLQPGEVAERSLVLGDTLKNSDVRIDAIKTSDPGSVAAAIRPIDEVVSEGDGYQVRGRYSIDLTISADDRKPARHETVTIHLSNDRTLVVPITWSVAVPFEITPRELTIGEVHKGRELDRVVFIRPGTASAEGLRIAESPPWIEAEIEPFGPDQWRLRATISPPEADRDESDQIVLATAREGVTITIPVRLHNGGSH